MDFSILAEILVLLVAAVIIIGLFLRLNFSPILGYLLVGVLIGPFGLGWNEHVAHARVLAEFGIVFLLFTIGLEFSLPLLLRMRNAVLGLGGLQVVLTTILVALISMYFDLSWEGAVIVGGIIAMSSTAMVIRQLTDQGELHTQHGRNAVGVLLFQDLMVVPFMILVPGLAGTTASPLQEVGLALGKGAAALLLILMFGRWVMRPLFRGIATFRSTELFTLTVLLVTLSAAWITHELGLSLALGAFVAGMMLGETEFKYQVEAEIRPFRDVLLGLFFITVGSMLEIQILPQIWGSVLLVVLVLVVFKFLLIALLSLLTGSSRLVAVRTGLILAHGGEFGFVILSLAVGVEVLPAETAQIVLAAILFSMLLTPVIVRFNRQLAAFFLPSVAAQKTRSVEEHIADTAHDLKQHVIICGYGRVGQNVSRCLENENIPFIALDLDPVRVQNAVKAREPVVFGNALNIELLQAAGLERAAALVISLDDAGAAQKILHAVRRLRPGLPILVRTPDETKIEELRAAGATEVIAESMETSLMLSAHLQLLLGVPATRVSAHIRDIRSSGYKLFRKLFPGAEMAYVEPGGDIDELFAVDIGSDAWAAGKRVGELGLQQLDVSVSSVQRKGRRIDNPAADFRLAAGDTLVLFGSPDHLAHAEQRLLSGK